MPSIIPIMEEKITSVVARESNGNIQITFTIPFSLIKRAQDGVIEELAKDIEIPGFRKGKAPASKAVEKISQSKLIEQSLTRILPKALADAITENKLKIAIYPKFELVSAKENEAWQVRGVTCELPDITLGDYKNIVSGVLRAESIIAPGKEAKEDSREKKEQLVIKTLLDSVKVEIPEILVQEEADSRLSNLLSRLEKLGLALESYLVSINKKAEDLRADYAKQAREAIALDLILSKIAESEDINISDKEIETAISMADATSKDKVSKTKEEIENHKRLLESILKRRAALDYLIKLL